MLLSPMAKPRMKKESATSPLGAVLRTEGSRATTSAMVAACWLSMAWAVKLVRLNGVFMASTLPSMPRRPPRAIWPPA